MVHFAATTLAAVLSFTSLALATPLERRVPSDAQRAEYLAGHNDVRPRHNAVPLQWSNTLAEAAQKWADRCQFQHSGGAVGPYGENLYAATGGSPPRAATDGWYSEVKDYDRNNPQYSHFTQMVWRATTELGCAVANCPPGSIFPAEYGTAQFHVCEYNPHGNVSGQFGDNVHV
ncbi:PR-1-like protein [Pterulicium gracile]|uniref:PR-1-like protein n=1 Tax=Pterulicium gracile TaxID=1884261 RepID=A0A5C3R197_9AGAR|nr:PR-1-like protein [Pterula gracilis]